MLGIKMSAPPASLFIEGGNTMGILNWLANNRRARDQRRRAVNEMLEMQSKRGPAVDSHMDQGDYHSGPEGYSPNTAYPETQYGSMFDEDAEWNEEH